MNLLLFYINLAMFLIPLVLALLSKMVGPSSNFIIFLMLFVLLLLSFLLLSFGGNLLLLLFTPSIDVLLPLFKIKLLMICCLVLLPPMTYLESLDVSILFFFKVMKETNFSLILVCVVFLCMELVKKVIGVMIPLANVFVFLRMWSFGNIKCFTNYLMFMFHLFPLSILFLTFFLRNLPLLYLSIPPWYLTFPRSISDVPSHASDEPPTLVINVPTDTALAMDLAGPYDSHALRHSHQVTTLPSHLRDFHCFLLLPLSKKSNGRLDALHKTGTWDLVNLPSRKSAIDCKWVYKIKTRSDGTIDVATPKPGPTRMASPNRNPGTPSLFLLFYVLLNFLFQKGRDSNPRPYPNGGFEPKPGLLRRFHLSYQNILLIHLVAEAVSVLGQAHNHLQIQSNSVSP